MFCICIIYSLKHSLERRHLIIKTGNKKDRKYYKIFSVQHINQSYSKEGTAAETKMIEAIVSTIQPGLDAVSFSLSIL